MNAAVSARSMAAACRELGSWVQVTYDQQQLQQQQVGVTQPQQEEQPRTAHAQFVLDRWLGLVLPAIPKVITQLAQHLARKDWPADAGSGAGSATSADGPAAARQPAGSAAGSSSSSSSSSSLAAAAQLLAADEKTLRVLGDPIHHEALLVCFRRYLSLVSSLGEQSIAAPQSTAAGDVVTVSFQGIDAWVGSAPALLAALEAFFRAAATNASAEGSFSAQMVEAIMVMAQLCGDGDTPEVVIMCALCTPHGSKVRQQLMSLICSVLKAVASFQGCGRAEAARTKSCLGFMNAALWLVTSPSCVPEEASGTAPEPGPTAAPAPARTASDPRYMQSVLFSLMLLGRCCLGVIQLAWTAPVIGHSAEAATGQEGESVPGKDGSAAPAVVNRRAAIGMGSVVGGNASRFNRLLLEQDGPNGIMQWLSRTGYDATGLQQLLQQTGTALGGMRFEDSACTAQAALRLLQQLGDALNSLAFARVCNNPGCVNLSGPSETSLVSGRSCMCAVCRVAHYCCRQCQKSHWKQHKPVCKALVAAAVAD